MEQEIDAIARTEQLFRAASKVRSFRIALRGKRVIDSVAAALLILTCLPLLALAAIAVKLSSPGPIVYAATRWGYQGRHFRCLKFRTMRVDQAVLLAEAGLSATDQTGRILLHEDDPRVTRIGAFLRATSLDELPQLLNVLRGDMSLIGPRPLDLPMLEPHPRLRDVRGLVRPGISGLWQVTERRKNVDAVDMARLDMEYIAGWNLLLDLRILVRTPRKVILAARAAQRPCRLGV